MSDLIGEGRADSSTFDLVFRKTLAAIVGQPLLVLVLGIVVSVALPGFVRGSYERFSDALIAYDISRLITFIAFLTGFLLVRKMSNMPGTRSLISVLPALIITYGLSAAIFYGLSMPFSRTQHVLSFILAASFLLAVEMLARRVCRPRIGLIPLGQARSLSTLSHIDWVVLQSPEEAERYSDLDLAVDFKATGQFETWERYLATATLRGQRVFSAKVLKESLSGRSQINHLSENPAGQLAPDALYNSVKRYGDALAAFMLLIVLMPLFLVIALSIRLESKGPSLFKQARTGYKGKAFFIYKFRSMRITDNNSKEADLTQTDDDRVTHIGRFIRRTRIDELPQLLNVLKGEMSLIGPRPETQRLTNWYETEIPFYHYRHVVRPGITGWAQVNQGHVTQVEDVREKLEYDLYYVRNFSIWLDILVGFKTLRVILTGHGAK